MDIDDIGDLALAEFINWFKANDGYLDTESTRFKTFPMSEGGRGMCAVKDIQEGHTLFSIPRHLILSTGACALPSLFGLDNWRRLRLNKGWAGLILCLMWERWKNETSTWFEYLAILPDHFDTPMFWGEDDLYELEGTAVVEKIGKDEANQEYNTKIVAALQSRMDLFHPDAWAKDYSLEMFHMMGSCILSRSFNVEPWHNMNTGSENKSDVEDDAMSDSSQDSDSQEESDAEGSSSIAMVPMADMLNARFGSENSKLFHEEDCLRMVTTKSIRAGEQIWNTYGDLPNSELLRRYGHVDLVPLPDGGVGNPGDVIEIQVDIVVEAVLKHHPTPSSAESRERIDWWLDNGGDDAIVIESDYEVPAVMLSLIRLFLLSKSEWEKTKIKSKPPKAKMEPDVIQVLITILQQRMKKYPSGLNDDESLLRQAISLNKKQAIVVRMGEKRILKKTLDKLQVMTMAEGNATKRKRVDNDGANRVKSRK